MMNLLGTSLFSPAQLAIVVLLCVLFALMIVVNVVLMYIFQKRGERKLCTHQLQNKRDNLMQKLSALHAGNFVAGENDDEDVEDLLLVGADEDEDEDDEKPAPVKKYLGVVSPEDVDETMDAEILVVAKTSKAAREKLGLAGRKYDDKRYYVRYALGFEAKLRLSSEEIKERYVGLMKEIALYQGLKIKSSYRQQRIYKGRKTLALIVFCGRTPAIAFALNPADYADTKYRGVDKSGVKRYANTPMLIKLTSARRLEYAKYLLVQLAYANMIGLEENPGEIELDIAEQPRDTLYVEDKLQITVLGEVPESVPKEPEEEDEDEEEAAEEVAATVAEDRRTRYDRSYTARIIQADDELKARYSEIKNHVLAYTDVYNRITWKREAFYVKRSCFATFAIRGKTLCMFLSVAPSRFDGTKYKVEDRTLKHPNAKMPTMVRIRSDRGTKFAKEMLDILLSEMGKSPSPAYAPVNFRPVYKSTENLIKGGYIRVSTVTVPAPEKKD